MKGFKKMDFQVLRNYTYNLERLRKISKSLHILDEKACNYELSKRDETREATLENEAQDIADRYGLLAYHQGDPRGCSLWLITSEIKASKQYTDGIAVY